MKKVLLIKYGEIALRGKNRSLFEKRLIENIRKNLSEFDDNYYVVREQGRFILEDLDKDINFEKVLPKVIPVLGIIGVAPCIRFKENDIETLKEKAYTIVKEKYSDKNYTFKVNTKRTDKNYPLKSNEISGLVGEFLLNSFDNLKVDVKKPEFSVNIELRTETYMYTETIKTFGGLPAGSSGKGVLLLSGGIDSPVAGYLMAKRGVDVICVHFASPPYTSDRATEKVKELAQRLDYFTGNIKLYVVPFTDIQMHIYQEVDPEKMTILLKRVMLQVSEKIAMKEKADGLITGDAVGQVASQTMKSMLAVSYDTKIPIYRPLSGFDKQEIIDIARSIETYEISNQPFEDCCTIFVAKHPETKPNLNVINGISNRISEALEPMIEKAIEESEIVRF